MSWPFTPATAGTLELPVIPDDVMAADLIAWDSPGPELLDARLGRNTLKGAARAIIPSLVTRWNGLLVGPSILDSRVSVARSQSGFATGQDDASVNVAYVQAAANTARWGFSPMAPVEQRGLLVERSGTNQVRNPRGEYTAEPTFPTATAPLYWGASANGLTFSFIGRGTWNGLPYIDLQVGGTMTGTLALLMLEDYVALAEGATMTGSACLGLMSGSTGSLTAVALLMRQATNGPTITADFTGLNATSYVRKEITQVGAAARTLTQLGIAFRGVAGNTMSGVLRIAGAQMEETAFATSPILPPAGTRANSVRGVETVTANLADFGIGSAGTVIIRTSLRNAPTDEAPQVLLQLDDATQNNRIQLRHRQPGLFVRKNLAGIGVDGAALGQISFPGEVVAALSWDELSSEAHMRGRPSIPLTGGLSPTRIVVGSNGTAEHMWGISLSTQLLPGKLSADEIQTRMGWV